MAYFIERVAGDVLRSVAVEVRQGGLIGVQLGGLDFGGWVVADPAEFGILYPKVRLDQFRRCEKPEDGCIARVESAAFLRSGRSCICLQTGADSSCASCQKTALHERATVDWTRGVIQRIFHYYSAVASLLKIGLS